jgi:hypothetical protein
MNYELFVTAVKGKDKITRFFNYVLCITVMLMGLYFLVDFNKSGKISADYFFLLLVAMGLYGFYRIPQDYKITSIASNKTVSDKAEIVKKYLEGKKLFEETIESNYFQIRYRNKYLTLIDMFIYIDNNYFYINVRQKASGGYLDFGIGKRATRKIITHIKDAL